VANLTQLKTEVNMAKIKVQETDITIVRVNNGDYISLTDMG
jgi:hypothetical protein